VSQDNFQLIGSFIIGIFPICLAGQVIAMGIKATQNYSSIELIHLKPMNKKSQEKKDGNIFETENRQQQSFGHFVLIGRNRVIARSSPKNLFHCQSLLGIHDSHF